MLQTAALYEYQTELLGSPALFKTQPNWALQALFLNSEMPFYVSVWEDASKTDEDVIEEMQKHNPE